MLSNMGLHYLVHYDFSVYTNLTLEFLCPLEVNTYKVPDGPIDEVVKLKTIGTMSFLLHNSDFEISIETLEDIFHIPTYGKCNVPKSFNSNELWTQIDGETPYIMKSAKASHIQNPVFRYIHNVLGYTLFPIGDNT